MARPKVHAIDIFFHPLDSFSRQQMTTITTKHNPLFYVKYVGVNCPYLPETDNPLSGLRIFVA